MDTGSPADDCWMDSLQPGPGVRILHQLPTGAAPDRVCLFASYDRNSLLADYVVHYLSSLQRLGFAIIFVSTSPRLPGAEVERLAPLCHAVVHRDNVGLDFGSWKTAMALFPHIGECRELLLANDSVYGPLGDLSEIFRAFESVPCDLWGLTENLERAPHLQSYFLLLRRSCLQHPAFRAFWTDLGYLRDKEEIINLYEVGLSQRLRGLKFGCLVPAGRFPEALNPTIWYWDQLIGAWGFPFLKVQLVRDEPYKHHVPGWRRLVTAAGYDSSLVDRHLASLTTNEMGAG